jgi:hypothetical protein
MGVLRKRDSKVPGTTMESILEGGRFGVQYPCLWEHLSVSQYEGGERRVLSTVTLFVDDGAVKACLNDRDNAVSGWAAGDTVEACLMALEKALRDGTVDWRAAPKQRGKKS